MMVNPLKFRFKMKNIKNKEVLFFTPLILILFLFLFIQNYALSDESKIKEIRGFPQSDTTVNDNINDFNLVNNTEKLNEVSDGEYREKSESDIERISKNKSENTGGLTSKNNSGIPIPEIKIVVDKKEIYHYQIQNVYIYDYGKLVVSNFHMKVYHRDSLAPSLGMILDIPFIKIKNKPVLRALYLPNWNADDGLYRIKLFYGSTELKTPSILSFIVKRRKPKEIKDGLSVVDLEMNKNVNERIIRGISGKIEGPEGILEWASFLNADALWILSGETTSFATRKPLKGRKYWDSGPIDNLKILEKYAGKYNIKIGAYIISFFVPGRNGVPDRYRSGLGYNSEKDYLYRSRHISLGSEKRINDLIDLAKQFQNDPYVSYIGFDFIRTGRADGYELVDEFVDEMNIKLDQGWDSRGETEKIKWLARKIEVKRDPIIIEKWRWWRAHKVALIIRKIIKEAKITKPVWVYTLGWEHGREHGQDPVMFFDAGVDIDAVMLYEANHNQYKKMMAQWQEYISSKQGNIIIGNCVDYKLLDSDTLTPPQELYRRNVMGANQLFKDGPAKGIFFHDIYRLLWGRKGNYKSWQYALSFVSSVFNMRQALGITDILTDIVIDRNIKNSDQLFGYLYLKNQGEHSLDLCISSFPYGAVNFHLDNSGKINKSKNVKLDLFDIKRIAFSTDKRDAFLRVQITNRYSYFSPLH